ncbi:chromosomal replication initiator protein DnaA [Candidatus Peregrinibacteria bacterium]|nr:chromosomal replication initiator protein DnaA [Candidatus Peregrinibacteria bacterium]
MSLTLKQLWQTILVRLKPTISLPSFKTWFQDTGILEKNGSEIVIGFPTPFSKEWVEGKYHIKIFQAAKEADNEIETIKYIISPSLANPESPFKVTLESVLDETDEKKVRKVRNKNEVHIGSGLKSRKLSIKYTLDNFIVGKDNRLAHAACMAVSNMPGGIYNPLYVFSAPGLGKTHLLQAAAHGIINSFPDSRVVYMTAEQFTNEIIEAIGKRRTKEFKDKYRTADCFVLDDIQFLENKDMSQMEFFHTFNDLYDSNKQIIVSSDSPPKDLDGFKERLKSRFGMGTVVEILPPDYETRFAILKQRCQDLEIVIDPEILEFIAFHMEGNVRDLIGVLMQVVSQSTLSSVQPSIKLVAEILRTQHKIQNIHDRNNRLAELSITSGLTMQRIIEAVSIYFNISKNDLIGPVRKREVLMPRHVCMYLIKHELDHSYEKIGEVFGNRNHTTVLHAYNCVAEKLKTDFRLIRDINAIKKEMGI